MAQNQLSNEAKTFIVQALACYDTPSIVAKAVNAEFGLNLPRQQIERYDPEKRAGRDLSKRWRDLFAQTRETFLADTSKIPVANRAVRLRQIGRIADKAESQGNTVVALQALEQAAKEVGDSYTNRRELTGRDGKPLGPAVAIITPGMTPQEAAEAYADTLHGAG